MTAHTSPPRRANSASSAATSFWGTAANPSGRGWNASCLAGCAVAASVASVRPWKLPSSTTTRRAALSCAACASPPQAAARAAARLRACRRASLMAHSLASAPELAKKVFHAPRAADGSAGDARSPPSAASSPAGDAPPAPPSPAASCGPAFNRSDSMRATSPRCST